MTSMNIHKSHIEIIIIKAHSVRFSQRTSNFCDGSWQKFKSSFKAKKNQDYMFYGGDQEVSNGTVSYGLGMSDAAKPPQTPFLR